MTIATEDLMAWLFQDNLVVGQIDMEVFQDVFLHLLPIEPRLIDTTQRLTEILQDVGIGDVV